MRVLFLSTNTALAAAVRYRLLQYFPHLEAAGIQCRHASVFDDELDRIIYRPGQTAHKLARLAARSLSRVRDVLGSFREDVVVLLREAFLVGPPVLEALLYAMRRPVVFDVDDAVWEGYDSPTYGKLARLLKCAWKANPSLRMASAVTAGNRYVADHARRFNRAVMWLPTVVDTEIYRPLPPAVAGEARDRPVVLGWIGSHSTLQYLRTLFPVLERLGAAAEAGRVPPFRVRVVGAGAKLAGVRFPLDEVTWSEEREVAEVCGFDVGLFPVVDDPWSRGKSGFKAVQYGAAGIPTVASPVTTNRDIVVDGETGLLADTPEAWYRALETLIREPERRRALGARARERIVARYSLARHAPRLAALLGQLARGGDPTRLPELHEDERDGPPASGGEGSTLGAARELRHHTAPSAPPLPASGKPGA